MADASPKSQRKKDQRSAADSDPQADRFIWFERARAIHNFGDALKQADNQALNLFELVADQMQRQFKLSVALYIILVVSSLIILIISLVFVLISTTNTFLQTFSLIGMPTSILALLIALLRNPIVQNRQLLNAALKLNVVFLSFVRRIQQSDLMLYYLFYESDPLELTKIYSLIQDFQNIVDQTMEEINQIYPN